MIICRKLRFESSNTSKIQRTKYINKSQKRIFKKNTQKYMSLECAEKSVEKIDGLVTNFPEARSTISGSQT